MPYWLDCKNGVFSWHSCCHDFPWVSLRLRLLASFFSAHFSCSILIPVYYYQPYIHYLYSMSTKRIVWLSLCTVAGLVLKHRLFWPCWRDFVRLYAFAWPCFFLLSLWALLDLIHTFLIRIDFDTKWPKTWIEFPVRESEKRVLSVASNQNREQKPMSQLPWYPILPCQDTQHSVSPFQESRIPLPLKGTTGTQTSYHHVLSFLMKLPQSAEYLIASRSHELPTRPRIPGRLAPSIPRKEHFP